MRGSQKNLKSSGSGGYMTKGSHVTTSGPLLLKDYKVKRCIMPYEFGQPVSAQLRHFGDASDSGYGADSYLRLMNKAHTFHCSELTAATLAVWTDRMMQDELKLLLEPNETSRFQTFVSSRVAVI